jgi:hypothetical protein
LEQSEKALLETSLESLLLDSETSVVQLLESVLTSVQSVLLYLLVLEGSRLLHS